MKSIVTLLLLAHASIVAAQESVRATRPLPERFTRAQMLADLDFLAGAVRADWSYLADKQANFGVDLDALVARAKGRLGETGTPAELHHVLLELVADLKDGHGHVFTPGVPNFDRGLPIDLADSSDGIVISDARNLPERWRGLRLLGIDGVPVADKLAALERTTIASTDGARRVRAIQKLRETDAPNVKLRLAHPAKPDEAREEVVETVPAAEAIFYSGRAVTAWEPTPMPGGTVLVTVPTFTPEDWAGWLKAPVESRESFIAKDKAKIDACFAALREGPEPCKALVIDLRGNVGGTDLLGIHVAKHLLPKRFVYFRLASKRDGKWNAPHGYEHDPLPPEHRFDGPLAVLIDEACFSTTDNFLRAVIENRDDVIVVGRPTNGGTGAPRPIATLPNSGAKVTLCTQRVSGPKGVITEGRGTVPTIPVRWTAADYREGRDPDLKAALEALSKAK